MNPIKEVRRIWQYTELPLKILFIMLILLSIFWIMAVVSAEPITLNNLDIQAEKKWCVGEFYEIIIIPQKENNTFVEIDNINIKIINNISYQNAPIYQRENKYVSHVLLLSNNNSLETINLTISVEQRGKIVEKITEIKIIEKGCKESAVSKFFSNAEKFIVEHAIVLIILAIIVVLIIVGIQISKLK